MKCNFLFNHTTINPVQILFAVNNVMGAFFEAHWSGRDQQASTFAIEEMETRWFLPPAPFVKINVDAS